MCGVAAGTGLSLKHKLGFEHGERCFCQFTVDDCLLRLTLFGMTKLAMDPPCPPGSSSFRITELGGWSDNALGYPTPAHDNLSCQNSLS